METKPEAQDHLHDNPAAKAWIGGTDLTMYTARRRVALRWLAAVCVPAVSLVVLSDRLQSGAVASLHTLLTALVAGLLVYAGYRVLKTGTRRVEICRDNITHINFLGTRRAAPLKEISSVSLKEGVRGKSELVLGSAAGEFRIPNSGLTTLQLRQIQALLVAKGGPCPLIKNI